MSGRPGRLPVVVRRRRPGSAAVGRPFAGRRRRPGDAAGKRPVATAVSIRAQPSRKPTPAAFLGVALPVAITIALIGCGGAVALPPQLSGPVPHPAECDRAAGDPEDAARAFLDLLAPASRAAAGLPFGEPTRSRWSNLPVGILDYTPNGARLGDLDAAQREALYGVLAAALSRTGCETVLGVVAAEGALSASPRAARLGWSADNYWLAFFGEPSDETPWGLQFAGHHLALNLSRVAGKTFLSPTFIGVEPAEHRRGGATIAPLRAHARAGLDLLGALDDAARVGARLPERPRDAVAGPGRDGVVPPFAGAPVAGWGDGPRRRLLDTVHLWVGLLPERDAGARMAEVQADLDETWFAWQGDPAGEGPIYYRIQGPRLLVEFSTQGDLGSERGHFHTMYRDPANEYGAAAVTTGHGR